ncbi:GNAT superfamily N-acetyltransferase [Actinoplanes lutulentus]|uniref:Ribosomal protein S18 acetylase RimI-like enzyme n=1 Tax=Actinoplanes lutulentus TaxID=1287878 RepID=A0A327ZKN0_9ACTN|nr:GNAT family N-acetyltransferase [Actinoplanes lutulentus]MBB2940629.1 GNAT superfamily N-acetyltransferase [Actinoplanes lutulentus]RAK42940.1 ribosomal protein S18 acetylase RimI-like enzyme [Actinoplanes lutulentus]
MSIRINDATLRHSSADEALRLREHLIPIYAATHAHLIDQSWYAPETFWSRLTNMYAKARDFDLVTAWIGADCIGYAFGSPRDGDSELWAQLQAFFPDVEASGPIYIFREFAVAPTHQRHGHGTRIHDELLRGRPEQIAHLLVRGDNEPAQAAYRRWGWTHIGTKRPFENSPTFDAMALDLGDTTRSEAE